MGIPARKKGSDAAGNMIVAGLFTNKGAPGAYGVYLPATGGVERRQRIDGEGKALIEERWSFKGADGNALDVTVQAQYLKLMRELQRELRLSIILITHDFGVVATACDRVAVMYAGRIVEQAPVARLFDDPRHPYTQALLGTLRTGHGTRKSRLATLGGQPPDLRDPPTGCRFAARCAHASDHCRAHYPPTTAHGAGHTSNCWLNGAASGNAELAA